MDSSFVISDEFENLADQNSKSFQAEFDETENVQKILRVVQGGFLAQN